MDPGPEFKTTLRVRSWGDLGMNVGAEEVEKGKRNSCVGKGGDKLTRFSGGYGEGEQRVYGFPSLSMSNLGSEPWLLYG